MRDRKVVDVPFRKASFSPLPLVYCVEVGVRDGLIRLRDSKDRDVELTFSAGEWDAFVRGVKAGEFDF
jgi:hypothetical protein